MLRLTKEVYPAAKFWLYVTNCKPHRVRAVQRCTFRSYLRAANDWQAFSLYRLHGRDMIYGIIWRHVSSRVLVLLAHAIYKRSDTVQQKRM